jgi:alkyl hydroperoxide reductase subunit AhpC
MSTISPWKRASRLLAASLAVATLVAADEPGKRPPESAKPRESAQKSESAQKPESAQKSESAKLPAGDAAEVVKALNESWPDHPEWVDMLVAILSDEPMSANYGWFRTAVAQTRFDWAAPLKRYDRDGDRRIARSEFPGDDSDFSRLDRDRDKALSAADFDFSVSALSSSPGALLFMRADSDGNGKVTREELDAFWKAADRGGEGFLSLSDLQEAFAPPPARPTGSSGRPSKATLVKGLFSQEIGSLEPGPKVDESAPDFTLKTNDGKAEITLSRLLGPKPVVLVFGSFTCGPFRSQSGNVEKLYRRYKDRATFVMVYVRDAHPTDGWRMESNDRLGAVTAQPKTYDERVSVAQKCGRVLSLGFPMLVDTIDDAVGARYSGMPGRLYVIDRDGKVAYKSGRGPYLFKPAEMEHSLILLLQEQGDQRASKTKVSLRGESTPRDDGAAKRSTSNE